VSKINRHETFVVFLDILGFRQIMKNNNEDELIPFIQLMSSILSDTKESLVKSLLNDDQFNEGDVEFIFQQLNVQSISLSDSIVLWTPNASPDDCVQLMIVANAILLKAFNQGFPLRGTMTFGELYFADDSKNSNVFGSAIVKAYEMEKVQEWSGVIIDPICIDHYRKYVARNIDFQKEDIESYYFTEYEVPKKSGKIQKEYVLNWPQNINLRVNHDDYILFISDSFARHGKTVDNWSVRSKINNTINFYKHSMGIL